MAEDTYHCVPSRNGVLGVDRVMSSFRVAFRLKVRNLGCVLVGKLRSDMFG